MDVDTSPPPCISWFLIVARLSGCMEDVIGYLPVVLMIVVSLVLLVVALQMTTCLLEQEGFWRPFFCTIEGLQDTWSSIKDVVLP